MVAEPELTAAIGARPPTADAGKKKEEEEEERYQANLQACIEMADRAREINRAKKEEQKAVLEKRKTNDLRFLSALLLDVNHLRAKIPANAEAAQARRIDLRR
eukprot:1746515-Alexandrium_andersonii.AAC.1